MSAYELTKFVEHICVKKWLKVGTPTIYQNLKKLSSKGYLSTSTVKEGNMPEKVIYTLTESGSEYFLELMGQFSENPGKIYFDFNAFVFNLDLVDKGTGLEMLRNLRQFFCSGKRDVGEDIASFPNVPVGPESIMRQYELLFDSLIQWVDELIEKYLEDEKLPKASSRLSTEME